MRFRSVLAATAVAALLTGCGGERQPEVIRAPEVTPTPPAYDATLEPAAEVMAIVPADATLLEVTDFDQVRFALGFGDLSSESPPDVRRRFWDQADRESPLLSPGMFRIGDQVPRRSGFTQDDVSWEAHFSGPSGEGYVVAFRDDLDMTRVQQAAKTEGSPIRGATVVPSAHLAAVGATREPTQSWAADPELLSLVGPKAGATYVSRDCIGADDAFDGAQPDVGDLQELGPFAVGFGGVLVTARLGSGRNDVFLRAELAEETAQTDPDFAAGYRDPVVGDPSNGRIGFELGDATVAARLAQERQLPFAVCGG